MNSDSERKQLDPATALGDVAASRGLLGIIKDAGNSTMAEPEKHAKILHEAKAHHLVKTEFPDTPRPRTMGARLGHHIADNDHEKASDTISGHPLTGLVSKKHMPSIMNHMAEPMMSQEPHPKAFRGAVDYLSNAHRGSDLVNKSVSGLFEKGRNHPEHNPAHIEDLKKHIDSLASNPQSMLDVGGDLGHYLPDHSTEVAALSARAVQYLSNLKPMSTQLNPLDTVLPPNKAAVASYDRQVALAQNPLEVLQHAKSGTLMLADVATIQTIYPKLYQSITDKIGEQLIDAKDKGTKIPYSMRASLGLLLGQPLDSTMTTGAMQAIMAVNGPKQGPQNHPGKAKAPATTLKAADKANKMAETPLQSREANRKQ